MIKYLKPLIILLLLVGCTQARQSNSKLGYRSDDLIIQKVTNHVYQHTSFLNTESFGKVPCNGMIVMEGNEAIIFNTTTDKHTSLELINWVENNLGCKIKAVIPTHFHVDCLGGLEAFHTVNIPSYAHKLTLELARSSLSTIPQNGFSKLLELDVGNTKVIAEFIGEGHTTDNIIGYLPGEKIIFGGCLIKELGAGKGNLEDANIKDWPVTVAKLKEKYPDTKIVIPGHGNLGGTELLDYTIELFQ